MNPSESEAVVRRKLALVANDKAGALLAGAGAGLPELLEAAGFDTTDIASGTLTQRLAQARDSGAELVVVAGGDGSIAAAAQLLVGSRGRLGIIPAGTMNLLARDLGIPAGDPAAAIRVLANGVPREIDVGELTGASAEGHVFLCAAMFGSPARLGHHREAGRRRGNGVLGWLHVGRAFLKAVRRHRALRLIVTIDGVRHRLKTPSLTITVNALDDGGGRMFARGCLDGGMLHLYALRHRSAAGFLRLLLSAARGRIASDPSVTALQGKTMLIDSGTASLRVLIDGEERLLAAPVRAGLRAERLRVLAAAP